MQATFKLPDIARDRRKTSKKEKEKRKIRKTQTATKIFFLLLLFYKEIYILLENMFGKTSFILLHLYYSFSGRL